VPTALVLSAGGLWAAWEVGVWKALQASFQPDLIVGASAGSWNGWAIAGGCTPEELEELWLEPRTGRIVRFGLHRFGVLRPEGLVAAAKDLFERFHSAVPPSRSAAAGTWMADC
jgi:predicted acylesterase/phospholipase RssA